MGGLLKTMEFHFYKIIIAIVILLIGLTIGLIVKKVLKKILHEVELDKMVKRLGRSYSLETRISDLTAYFIYFITFVIFLNQLGITSIVLYILVGAVLLLLGATFLLGVKDFIPNLISGLVIYKKGYWKKGKKIKIDEIEGKIEKAGLLEMIIETKKGDKIYLPNSLLIKSKVWLRR